jgi:uncharacterized membrane protein YoaK (UPF0700 family)
LVVVGSALIVLQAVQLWRERRAGHRSRTTLLLLLLGLDLIVAPLFHGGAEIVPVIFAVGLVAAMIVSLFNRRQIGRDRK